MPATDAPGTDAPALDASMPVTDAPVDELCKKRRVRATSEEEDEPEKVLEVEEEKNDLFTEEFEGDTGVVVEEAYAKRPRAPLAVTKETILAAIELLTVATRTTSGSTAALPRIR